jgi:Na+/H+ antiporter NhaD/arsenite permease-like protein
MGFVSEKIQGFTGDNIPLLSVLILWMTGILSPLTDSIPLAAAMIPVIKNLAVNSSNVLWWALVLGACFGTNGTIIAGYANIVTADISKKNKYPISFWIFFKYGSIVTVFNLLLSTIFLLFWVN